MLEVAECIDHRDAGVLRHAGNGGMRKCSQHDAIDPALEVVRDVAQLLAGVDARGRLIDKHCMSAEAGDARFKGKPRAQRGLLEEHDDLLTGKGAAKIRWARLQKRGEVENAAN